jgi:hypothetical protein
MSSIDALMPATPGTYVLVPRLNDDHFEAVQVNVVGWAATSEGLAPVTVAGVNHGQDAPLAVLQPDGRVEEPDGQIFPSRDEWKRATVRRVRAAQP